MTSIFLLSKSLHKSKSHHVPLAAINLGLSLLAAGSDAQGRQKEDPQPENTQVPMDPTHSDHPESQGVSAGPQSSGSPAFLITQA